MNHLINAIESYCQNGDMDAHSFIIQQIDNNNVNEIFQILKEDIVNKNMNFIIITLSLVKQILLRFHVDLPIEIIQICLILLTTYHEINSSNYIIQNLVCSIFEVIAIENREFMNDILQIYFDYSQNFIPQKSLWPIVKVILRSVDFIANNSIYVDDAIFSNYEKLMGVLLFHDDPEIKNIAFSYCCNNNVFHPFSKEESFDNNFFFAFFQQVLTLTINKEPQAFLFWNNHIDEIINFNYQMIDINNLVKIAYSILIGNIYEEENDKGQELDLNILVFFDTIIKKSLIQNASFLLEKILFSFKQNWDSNNLELYRGILLYGILNEEMNKKDPLIQKMLILINNNNGSRLSAILICTLILGNYTHLFLLNCIPQIAVVDDEYLSEIAYECLNSIFPSELFTEINNYILTLCIIALRKKNNTNASVFLEKVSTWLNGKGAFMIASILFKLQIRDWNLLIKIAKLYPQQVDHFFSLEKLSESLISKYTDENTAEFNEICDLISILIINGIQIKNQNIIQLLTSILEKYDNLFNVKGLLASLSSYHPIFASKYMELITESIANWDSYEYKRLIYVAKNYQEMIPTIISIIFKYILSFCECDDDDYNEIIPQLVFALNEIINMNPFFISQIESCDIFSLLTAILNKKRVYNYKKIENIFLLFKNISLLNHKFYFSNEFMQICDLIIAYLYNTNNNEKLILHMQNEIENLMKIYI